MTAERRFVDIVFDCVFWMGAIKIGIGVDHLWFHPNAELKTFFFGGFCQGSQTTRYFLKVAAPIAKAMAIIVSFSEPAIVEHECLRADLFGFLHQGDQLSLGEVEHRGFPVVVDDWAWGVVPSRGDD